MTKTIALFAREDDPIAARLEALLSSRGVRSIRVELGRMAEGMPVRFDGERWWVQGVDLSTLGAYVLRHFPTETALLSADASRNLTAAEWWRRGIAQKERAHFAQSVLMALDVAGTRAVNPRLPSAPYDFKPLQLAAFRRAGLPVPQTLVTNEPESVRGFHRAVGEVVAKPVAGGAATRLLDDDMLQRLDAIRSAPVIFQERIPGRDVRVTVVDGEVVSAVEIAIDAIGEIDYRASSAYQEGRVQYTVHALPDDVGALCVRAAHLCHHVLSGIDLKRREDGAYVLLEANSAPVYLDIEEQTGAPISERIVGYLMA